MTPQNRFLITATSAAIRREIIDIPCHPRYRLRPVSGCNVRTEFHVIGSSITGTWRCRQYHSHSVMARYRPGSIQRLSYPTQLKSVSIEDDRRWLSSKPKKGKKRPQAARNGRGGGGAGSGKATSETAQQIMTMTGVRKELPGGRELFGESNLSFNQGAKIGVLGVNGSGKSTVLKILAGVDKEFDGSIWVKNGIQVKYLPQEPDLDPSLSVMDNIRRGIAEQEELVRRFEEVSMAMAEPDANLDDLLEEQASLQTKIEDADAWNVKHRVETAMRKLRVPPPDSSVSQLSGGERRRVALCRLLLEQPDICLLDEPTNHLDAESVRWLEDYLRAFKGTVISITHDRYFLDNVAGWILEVDRGQLIPYEGNYSAWLVQKQRRLDMEHSKQAQMAKRLSTELKWIQTCRANVTKARAKDYEKTLAESKDSSAKLQQLAAGAIFIPPGPRLGQKVIKVKGLAKSYGDRTLFRGVSFDVDAGSVVGVVGPNGSGKSTLFNIIAGLEQPDQGSVEWGASAKVGLVNQSRGGLDPEKTAYEEISQGEDVIQHDVVGERALEVCRTVHFVRETQLEDEVGDKQINVRAYVAAFNLRGAAQEKRLGSMSGGERNRVHLAKVLREGNNVLLLDEPTNDLDVDTLRSLEDAIHSFAGSVLIVSHDRWFLDRVCSHTIAFEEEPKGDNASGRAVIVYPGNHSEYAKEAAQRGVAGLG